MKEPLSNTPESHKLFILGAGPAGLTAALYAGRSGLDVTVFEKNAPGGQMNTTPEIENYPGFPRVSGYELSEHMRKQAAAAGALFRSTEVTGVDLSGSLPLIRTVQGEEACDALIIATGSGPRRLGVEGEARLAGRGVSYCAVCDGFFFKGKNVAVIGGGKAALEDALYLADLCSSVTLIHRRDTLQGGTELERLVRERGNIRLVLSAEVEEILGAERVENVRVRYMTENRTEELPVSAVFVAIGSEPQTELVRDQLALDKSGRIIAGEDTRTSHPAVFVAGDVRTKALRQIVTAAADGAVAATMAGRHLRQESSGEGRSVPV